MYEYTREAGLGTNTSFMFLGNKLQNKSQFDLKKKKVKTVSK